MSSGTTLQTPQACIFIKSYLNDLEWLKHSLRSIQAFFEGPREIVLVLDENCRATVSCWGLTQERVHYVPDHPNGYIQQQAVKLRAHRYTDAPFIVFMDSDTILCRPCSLETLCEEGRPIVLKTPYADLADVPWREPTEATIGQGITAFVSSKAN